MPESSVVVTAGELEEVAAGYRRYLLVERGLSVATVDCYEPRARRFLAQSDGPRGLLLAELTAADVSGFLALECPRHGAASAQLLVDEPKGDPTSGRGGTQLAETDLHVRSYAERHMR